jgi:hypothetical protein
MSSDLSCASISARATPVSLLIRCIEFATQVWRLAFFGAAHAE